MKTEVKSRVRAFTMVELMAAVTIAISLILMLYTIFDKVTRVFVEGQSRAVAMEEGRAAMDMIVADIERMGAVIDENQPHLEWVPFSASWNEFPDNSVIPPVIYYTALASYHPQSQGFSSYIHTGYPWPQLPLWSRTTLFRVPRLLESEQQKIAVLGEYFITNPVDQIMPQADFFVGGSAVPPPVGSIHDLYHHNIRFYSHTDNWRFIQYKLGGMDEYRTCLAPSSDYPQASVVHLKRKIPNRVAWPLPQPDTPVGALWVYRSAGRLQGEVKKERNEHKDLVGEDTNGTSGLGGNLAFTKLIEGVIHFRVRAINPDSKEFPGRELEEFRTSFYPSNPFKDGVLPTHVEVELAVLDRNLLKKVQIGMEQELEGLTDKQKYDDRLAEIRGNLDRVYFFKQLVKIKEGGGI